MDKKIIDNYIFHQYVVARLVTVAVMVVADVTLHKFIDIQNFPVTQIFNNYSSSPNGV